MKGNIRKKKKKKKTEKKEKKKKKENMYSDGRITLQPLQV